MAVTKISNTAAIAMCDACVDLIDGAVSTAGSIRIYTGTAPGGGPDDSSIGGTLLAVCAMSNPAFNGASDANPGGRATAGSITDGTGLATGTAGWFRVIDGDDTAVIDGDVSSTGGTGALKLDVIDITTGGTVSVTAYSFTVLEA